MTLNPTVLTYADLKTSIETVNDSPAPQVSVEPHGNPPRDEPSSPLNRQTLKQFGENGRLLLLYRGIKTGSQVGCVSP